MVEDLKRYAVKYIRDRVKSRYPKGASCDICGSVENLDFHHWYSLSELYHKWCKKNKISINTVEDIMQFRDVFIKEHEYELLEATSTLCHTHHEKLHSIYGKSPSLITAKKQERWISIQREKHQ